jgi:2-amino-4-hydroxy-6-hydroxymethyldihydropteridine diphosphokinase
LNTAYLSLGTNLGDRAAQLRGAIERLNADGIRVVRESSIYETEPLGFEEQPWFLNMAVEVETDLTAERLLEQTQQIEKDMGRKRFAVKGPRIIDIDILFFGNAVIQTLALEIPHPGMAHRRFVLEPLAEIAPELRHPVLGKTILEMLESTRRQRIRPWNG